MVNKGIINRGKFPELGPYKKAILIEEIDKYCLSKQRVKEAIEKCTFHYFEGKFGCVYVDDLLKELGLSEKKDE